MAFLSGIKKYLLKSDLNKSIDRTKKHVAAKPYELCKTIGLIYIVGEEKDQIEFTNFVSSLQSEGKEIRALGIINYKNIPHYCYPKLSYDYLTLKDINWIKKPTGAKYKDFIKKDFDLLINFDQTNNSTLNYIAAVASAGCKTGIFNEENQNIYDLMIEGKSPVAFKELSDHYFHYIKMFLHTK